jgi:hypothetical protein
MQQEIKRKVPSNIAQTQAWHGKLLGVVVDLSGSMQANLKNDHGGQFSKIESLSKSFQRAIENIERLIENTAADESVQFRLFIFGFGFCVVEQPLCDILAAFKLFKKKMNRYQSLQSELKQIWLLEIGSFLEKGRMTGDAKEQLHLFIEKELREKAIEAEQKRSVAKFQRWCESACLRLDKFKVHLDALLVHSKYIRLILTPLIICLLWLLRGPALALAYLNRVFEAWVQKKLTEYRINANKYSMILSDKVVTETKKAVDAHQQEIDEIILGSLRDMLDHKSLEFIRLYNMGRSKKERKDTLNWESLKIIYEELTGKIGDIIRPQATVTWNKNLFKYKQAARILRVKPDWGLLRIKTIQCAYQAVWQMTEPYVQHMAEDLAKQRFVKAALAITVESVKDKEVVLPIHDVAELLQQYKGKELTIDELPIFGASVMGQALSRTLERLQREIHTRQNRGLRPILLIISDGEVIDQTDPLPIAEKLKRLGVTIVCCFLADKNIRRPWILRRWAWWLWPRDAKLMFSMASTIDDWPEFSERLKDSRFVVKKHARLFVQINHSEYLENFVHAILLPLNREHGYIKEQMNE